MRIMGFEKWGGGIGKKDAAKKEGVIKNENFTSLDPLMVTDRTFTRIAHLHG